MKKQNTNIPQNNTDQQNDKSVTALIFQYFYCNVIIVIPVAVVIGSVVAFFLWLLSQATHIRFANGWLLFLLPLAGVLIHFIYRFAGKSSERGNVLIMDEIHKPGAGVPRRMGPIILLTTIITHLFGGSAGREGTAVQIGGSIAAGFAKLLKFKTGDTSILLTAGIAAGFGAVFGTPITGAIFAIEVITTGRIKYKDILPALIASFIADQTVAAWGIHHTAYHIDIVNALGANVSDYGLLIFKVIVAAIAFGLVSYLFAMLVHEIKGICLKWIEIKWLIPVIGGLVIILITFLIGKSDYLGLGVDAEYPGAITIPSAFHAGGAASLSWLWKTIYTSITLGTGFKGGEVTPLFYIGATMGNTLASLFGAPVSLFAALGFIAVFSGATNTPVACTFMGYELFGGHYFALFALACFVAYLFSGNSGIYTSHRTPVPKVLSNYLSGNTPLAGMTKRRSYLYCKLHKYAGHKSEKNID